MKNQDNPKTLDEAITNAICIAPLNLMHERACQAAIDFVTARFVEAMIDNESDDRAKAILTDLFVKIIERGFK